MPSPAISFEFYPPRTTEQQLILESTWKKLAHLDPAYLSVTFGAGGTSLDATLETVESLIQDSGVPVAPHISCIVRSRARLRDLLERYRQEGVDRLVVLRGDRPDGMTGLGPFQYASELVAFVRQEFGDDFHIEERGETIGGIIALYGGYAFVNNGNFYFRALAGMIIGKQEQDRFPEPAGPNFTLTLGTVF